MPRYTHRRLAELAHQLTLGNTAQRLEQLDAAERFVQGLDVQQAYGYDEIVLALTGYCTREPAGRGIPGRAVLADIVTLVEDLSASMRLSVESAAEPVLTSEQLAERFDVSLKTIGRWRRQGLVARRFVKPDGRSALGFKQSGVDWFERTHEHLVARGRRFTQMTEQERGRILDLARQARQETPDLPITLLAARVAEQAGRSVETIRYTLRRYDRDHPGEAIVAEHPADAAAHRLAATVLASLRAGDRLADLAARIGRSPDDTLAMAQLERLHQLQALKPTPVMSPEFRTPGAAVRLLAVALPLGRVDRVLTLEEEREGFRQYNFRKYLVSSLLSRIDAESPDARLLDQAEAEWAAVVALRNWLVQCNVRLVVRIARQHVSPGQDFADAVSEGNLALMRAVEKFDYTRGIRFSTYAGWAIMKTLASRLPAELIQRRRAMPVENDILTLNADLRAVPPDYAADQAGLRVAVADMLRKLTDRERAVLIEHFGLGTARESTLEQIGARWGLSKERVRQIKVGALAKLRDLMPSQK